MTSKDVVNYLEVEGMAKLYKKFEHYFQEVGKWSERFATGDLLNELELSQALDRLTGIFQRFHITAEAIDAYKINKELDYKVKAFNIEGKKPIVSQIEEEARASTKELRTFRTDFQSYADAAEKGIVTAMARIKRLSVEIAVKKIDFKGDTSQPAVVQKQIEEKHDVGWTN